MKKKPIMALTSITVFLLVAYACYGTIFSSHPKQTEAPAIAQTTQAPTAELSVTPPAEAPEQTPVQPTEETIVYITKTGRKYHVPI